MGDVYAKRSLVGHVLLQKVRKTSLIYVLETVYQADPILKRAHQLKEHVRIIFETCHTVNEARKAVQNELCKAYQQGMFPPVITQMKTWLTPICNDVRSRTTNGPAEGVNTHVKLIQRRAYGMCNFTHFGLRILGAFLCHANVVPPDFPEEP